MTKLIYGFDSAAPPDVLDSETIWSNGWRYCHGYLGGPRCYFSSNGVPLGSSDRLGWGIGAFARVQSVGLLLGPPIYVGRTVPYDPLSSFTYNQGVADGDDANNLMGASGFDENQPLTLDAEYGDFEQAKDRFYDYVAGFTQTVQKYNPNRLIELYSDSYTLSYFGPDQGFSSKWGADYGRRAPDTYNPLYNPPPTPPSFDPLLPPPWQRWQFCAGARYDVNSCVADALFAICTPP